MAASLALVAIAAIASRAWHAGLEEDIGIAVVRSFLQLTAIGYVITVIFDENSAVLVIALIAVMVVFGAFTARETRAAGAGRLLAAADLAAESLPQRRSDSSLGLGIFAATPRYVVPVGGMVVGNSMTSAAVALNRLGEDVHDQARRIEATLALGATSTEAVAPLVRRSLRSGMITLVDSTKTTGLIFFPGTMVGMLLAGADPTDAVRLQLILLYVLLGAVSIAAMMAITLARRNFFTPAHQLREPPEP